jgi:hypothetical protein
MRQTTLRLRYQLDKAKVRLEEAEKEDKKEAGKDVARLKKILANPELIKLERIAQELRNTYVFIKNSTR